MKKNKKEKKKVKLKKKSILLILLLVIIIVGIIIYLIYNQEEKNALKKLNNNYNKYVITTRKTKLYDKNKKVIGTISKNYELELKEIKKLTLKNKLLNIKDTTNYISYKDIKKTKEITNTNNSKNYIIFNKNIKTDKKIILKQNKKEIILDKGINTPIEYMDEDYYYISFLNSIFKVKKNKSIKEIKNNNTKEKSAEYISVLHYESVKNSCEESNCFDKDTIQIHSNLLKENGYYFITKEEYLKYINNYLLLKEKAILLTTNEYNDDVKNINEELNINITTIDENDKIKFENTNKKSTPNDDHNKINRYLIKSYTTTENILKMANGEDVVETEPPKNPNQGIAVLNYHFFYDPATQTCDETICLKVEKFREHLEYLKNNGYKTLTMKEFVNWMYGKIELPEKSVLITVDDGAMGTGKHNGNHLITLLEEYKMHATLFLIAGWWDISNYESPYLEVQSHTFDMHKYGDCGKGQLVCANYDEAKADLQKSLDIIKDNTSFCYPFYRYDDEAIQAIKDLGFKAAFVGGNVKAKRSNNKYLIPRYPITSDITLQDFINKIS